VAPEGGTRRVDLDVLRIPHQPRGERKNVILVGNADARLGLRTPSSHNNPQSHTVPFPCTEPKDEHGRPSEGIATKHHVSTLWPDCNREDLIRLFETNNVHAGKRDALLAEFDDDPFKGIASAERYLWSLRYPRAQESLREAKNCILVAELYFSTETWHAFEKFHAECSSWLIDFEMSGGQADPDSHTRHEQLNAALEEVQRALRADLTDPTKVLGLSSVSATTASSISFWRNTSDH
jgi:hypothetical protein